MALDSSARMANIKLSLDQYVYANLKTTEGLSVDYEGVPFDETSESLSWIQPRLLTPISTYYRQGSSTQYGEDLELLFQINIFVKKSGVTTSFKHYDIRDRIANYFKVGQDINIKAYAEGGSTQVAVMRVREMVTDFPIEEDPLLYQYSLAWIISHTRLTAFA
jgi:hypothetical protein